MKEFINNQQFLIDRWCSRKYLEPLRHLLNGQASLNGLSDGMCEMLHELKTIRANYSHELPNDEFEILVSLIHFVERSMEN